MAIRAHVLIGVLALVVALTSADRAAADVVAPPANAPWDYQLGGAFPPDPGVGIVTRDRTVAPAEGAYGVCYVNAFQTQPAEHRWWRARHPDLLLRAEGREVTDPGYPDEVLLDISTARRRAALAAIVGRWMDGCARDGYDAVEPDNLDSWTRSRGRLRRADAVAFASRLVRRAHAVGLAIAQKNASELARIGRERIHFDFAVAEECHAFAECGAYTAAYGDEVLEVEYDDAGGERGFRGACRALGDRLSIIYRDRAVVPRGRPGHRSLRC